MRQKTIKKHIERPEAIEGELVNNEEVFFTYSRDENQPSGWRLDINQGPVQIIEKFDEIEIVQK